MKKIITYLVLFSFLLIFFASCAHSHTYSEEWTIDKEATCTEAGSKSHHCLGCDDKTDVTVIPKLDHTYDDWKITKEPTETETGTKERECSSCHTKETETLPVISHTHHYSSDWTIDKEATCTEAGSKSHHCLGCDGKTDVTVISKLDHTYGDWKITKEPTETETGTKERECNICHKKETESLPVLIHTHHYSTDWTIDKEATCTEVGSKSHHCLGCDVIRDITVIPALGHSFGNWTLTVEPTIIARGLLTRVCESDSKHKETYVMPILNKIDYSYYLVKKASCDEKGLEKYIFIKDGNVFEFTNEVKALGHNYGEWMMTIEPTETTTGTKERECSNCHSKETETLPVLIHTHHYSTDWTIDKEATCTEAGSKSHHCLGCDGKTDVTSITAFGHSFGNWALTAEPTIIARGLLTRVCESDSKHKETYVMPVLNQIDYSYNVVKKSSCEEKGLEKYTFMKDEDVFELTNEVEALGHSYGEWMTTIEPTETTTGTKERECSNCHSKETETLPVLIHTHHYSTDWTIDKEATCTEAGSKSYHCLGCDNKKDITTIPALGHSFGSWKVSTNPDKVAYGLLTRICGRDSSHSETCLLPKLNKDDYQYVLMKSPLCEEKGIEKYTFIKDGDVFEFTNEVEALGHSYGEWMMTIEPTETTTGTKERECSNCHTKETETLPVLEHIHHYSTDWIIDKEATCTEAGSKSYHCLGCDNKKDITTIPVLGHSFGSWKVSTNPDKVAYGLLTRICGRDSSHSETCLLPELNKDDYQYVLMKSPLCEEKGIEKYTFIKDGDVFEFTNEVEALGHSYGEWMMTIEPTETTTGTKERECSNCHTKETETLPVLIHTHNYSTEWTIDKEATCTEAGSKSHHCLGCDAIRDITDIPVVAHSYEEWITTKEPTETTTGTRQRECKVCHLKETETLPVLEHIHHYSSDWTIDKEATCIEAGSKSYHCLGCDNKKDITTIPVLGHSFGSWQVTVKPSISSQGLLTRVCSRDSKHKNTLVLPTFDQQNYRYRLEQSPLCDAKGIEKYTFTQDGEVFEFTRELEELGHNFGNWEVTTEPTLTSEGLLTRVCSRNENHKETFVLPMLNKDSYSYTLVSTGTCIRPSSETYEYRKDNRTFKFYVGQYSSHSTNDNLYYNESKHWALCSVCGCKVEADHDFKDNDCSNCNYNKILGTKGLIYEENNAQGYIVHRGMGTVQDLTIIIPEKYNDLPVVGISSFLNSHIVSIVIPKSVTSIESYAFQNCNKLENVYYEGTIEEWCSIHFEPNYATPMSYASHFYLRNNKNEWEEVTNIEIPSSMTIIGQHAFDGFNSATSVLIPNTVKSIGDYAFSDCSNLTSIYYEGSIEEWCSVDFGGIFSNPMSRTSHFYLKNGNNEWEEATSIVIPKSVTSISEYSFYNFNNLINVYYEGTIVDWCNINFKTNIISSYYYTNPMSYASHFYLRNSNNEWEEVTSIIIPKSVTKISEYAFYGFENLVNVYYEGSIEEWCNINFGHSTSNPMYYASHFYLRNSNNEWEEVTSIIIPKSVTNIKESAFTGFDNLENVYYEGTMEDWCNIEFGGRSVTSNPMSRARHFYLRNSNNEWEEVLDIEIPNTITKIGHAQFAGFNMSTLTIPGTVTTIDMVAFYNCVNLTKVVLQEGVVTLGESAFESCDSLTSAFLPQSLTQFNMKIFYKCENLKSIYYEGSIEDWCNLKFKNVSMNPMFYASHFYLRNSNNSWEELTHLKLPQTIDTIGIYQFAGFNNIYALTIPKNIKKINMACFAYCEALTNVYYEGTIEDWCKISFGASNSNPMYYASHLFILGPDGEWEEVKDDRIFPVR